MRFLILFFILFFTIAANADQQVGRVAPPLTLKKDGLYLLLEFPDDKTVHFEYAKGNAPGNLRAIERSLMVVKKDFKGATELKYDKDTGVGETGGVRIKIDKTNLCFSVEDKKRNRVVTSLCPGDDIGEAWKSLKIDPRTTKNVLGLGQNFLDRGEVTANGDWMGEVFTPMDQGNGMKGVLGGSPSLAQFPILYALGDELENFALFLDQPYKIKWDLKQNWWKASMFGDQIRGYVMTGANLAELHHQYMELTGLPPVPPKQALGLWTSEFGYTSWTEIEEVLSGLRKNKFPVEGFMLDIQWFNLWFNVPAEKSRMGALTFNPKDTTHFPDADKQIRSFKDRGISLGLIQEPYLSEFVDTNVFSGKVEVNDYKWMSEKGYLAKDKENGPTTKLTANPWWGVGGLIDFTHPEGSDIWFDKKIKPLVDKGVLINWTDLTEPEMYNAESWYYNKKRHADVHNIFALSMAGSIFRGYERNKLMQRPYIISRSGTSGIQRYAAGMWSGDVGANMASLAAHYNSRMHMSLAGINYYSSDVGGFHPAFDGDPSALYTQWFANASLLDIPLRPHAWTFATLENKPENHRQTAPHRIGDLESNRENLRQRYELTPYYYSLAHTARLTGVPIMPPLAYYYQTDRKVRNLGDEVHIGPSLLTAIVAKYGQVTRPVYFPKKSGRWVDFYNNEWYDKEGDTYDDFPLYREGKFRIPLFAKAGAIIPMTLVDEQTQNILGQRADRTAADDLRVRVFADAAETRFTLYEDDGISVDYLKEENLRTTVITQRMTENRAIVTVQSSKGDYAGSRLKRNHTVELIVDGKKATKAFVTGDELKEYKTLAELAANKNRGFVNLSASKIIARSGEMEVKAHVKEFTFELEASPLKKASLLFVCENGKTQNGEDVFVSGNIAELGNWDTTKAVKLDAKPYPVWTKLMTDLPAKGKIEWKCLRSKIGGGWDWEKNANHVFNVAVPGYNGKAVGGF